MSVSEQQIAEAVAILRRGGLVAFPTETVYGLGADASNPQAVTRIFAAKGRPADHPLIVHIASAKELPQWVANVSEAAQRLIDRFWPGPLTLVLKRSVHVHNSVTGGQDTVGIRCPSHPVAQQLLVAFGGGIAAPSANRFGHISPTTSAHVKTELGDRVDLVLDGGQSEVGLESTILDLSTGVPVLLRPGMISVDAIQEVLGTIVRRATQASPRASGMRESHYAPNTPMTMLPYEQLERFVNSAVGSAGVLSRHPRPTSTQAAAWIVASSNVQAYAHDLYAHLRALDEERFQQIVVETVPDTVDWDAVRDRLTRACSGNQT